MGNQAKLELNLPEYLISWIKGKAWPLLQKIQGASHLRVNAVKGIFRFFLNTCIFLTSCYKSMFYMFIHANLWKLMEPMEDLTCRSLLPPVLVVTVRKMDDRRSGSLEAAALIRKREKTWIAILGFFFCNLINFGGFGPRSDPDFPKEMLMADLHQTTHRHLSTHI